jgi:glycosyltransferase involved in cell wall biosynthesis
VSSASRLRTFNWLLHFSRRFEVTLVAPAWHHLIEHDLEALHGRCREIVAPTPMVREGFRHRVSVRLVAAFSHALSGMPALRHHLSTGNVRAAVKRVFERRRFDFVFADHWAWCDSFFAAAPIRVLDAGELQSAHHSFDLELSRNPLLRFQRDRLARLHRNMEAEVIARSSLVLVRDSKARSEMMQATEGRGRTLIIPAGLDTTYFRARRGPINPRNVVFFTSLDGPTQRDALQFLHRELLPSVRDQVGDVRLTVVAPESAPELEDVLRRDPTVRFTGPLDDPRTELSRAAVAVLPLRFGSGAPDRLAQLLSMGVPTVVTPVAARGLDVASGDGVLIADEEAEFSNAVSQVLLDKSLRKDLSRRARETAETRLSMEATYGRLISVLEEALDAFGPRFSS